MIHFSKAKTWFSSLSDNDIRSIARQIDTEGFFCASDFLSEHELQHLQTFVLGTIRDAGNRTVSLGKSEASLTGLNEFSGSPEFTDFIGRLHTAAYGPAPSDLACHQVLRCLTGDSASAHSWMFHYDSYLITALVPIEVPATGLRGDFLLIPNRRQKRSSYLINLIDKVLLDNALTQRRLRGRLSDEKFVKRVPLTPGSIYLFWGYRSIHTNEGVDQDAIRATALFHFVDPHANSILKRKLGRA